MYLLTQLRMDNQQLCTTVKDLQDEVTKMLPL